MPSSNRHAEFDLMVERYGGLIASIVRKVAGRDGAAIAEDVEQRVIMALWRRLEGEQTIEYPASYLYRMAVRETIHVLRQELGRPFVSLDEVDVNPAGGHDPHQALQASETRIAIRAGLGRLTVERRKAVNQHLAGRTVAEIMAMYGWTYQRARNLIARGLADLRHTLREYRA
jgi:RNA polymerase sigma factor (sigma-70 family)